MIWPAKPAVDDFLPITKVLYGEGVRFSGALLLFGLFCYTSLVPQSIGYTRPRYLCTALSLSLERYDQDFVSL
ncbi:hypothetical protein P167DRAFT_29895 [Morchella conica CCBAS932]|uniref:Uncharacterized protein n=1 Tax=Morchella conica CCBAS932 TaxID=1392247 RepID=A0A3N4L019_9PEZI|nr:hypothetical protein P167DRAFT_29895 [Morchella conica CCBAS932]